MKTSIPPDIAYGNSRTGRSRMYGKSGSASQRDLHPDGRRRLRRLRLLRAAKDRDSQHRRVERMRRPLHGHVLCGTALFAGTLRPADGAARRPCADPRQRRDGMAGRRLEPRGDAARFDARRTGPARSRHPNARLGHAAGRIRHGHDRQMGRRRPRDGGHAQQNGLRHLLRLHLPAAGAHLLPPFLWQNDRRIYLDNELLPPGTPLDAGPTPTTRAATTNTRSAHTAPMPCTTRCSNS